MWIQTGVTVRKRLSWVVTSVTLTFDLWPWPFAWTSLLSLVITPENFMMIRWWEHSEKGVTDGQTDRQTDGRTDWTSHIAAWSQLKIRRPLLLQHYGDVVMGTVASQITSLTIVYSTVYSGADQRNITTPRHWPLCGEFTGDRWIPRTNGQ